MAPRTPSCGLDDEDQDSDCRNSQSVESSDGSLVVPTNMEDAFGPLLTAPPARSNAIPSYYEPTWSAAARPALPLPGPPYDGGLNSAQMTPTLPQCQTSKPLQSAAARVADVAAQHPEKYPLPSCAASTLPQALSSHHTPAMLVSKYKAAMLRSKYKAAVKKEQALREEFDAAVLEGELTTRQVRARIDSLHAEWQSTKAHRERMEMFSQGCGEAMRVIDQYKRECSQPHAARCEAPTCTKAGLSDPILGTEFITLAKAKDPGTKGNMLPTVDEAEPVEGPRADSEISVVSNDSMSANKQVSTLLRGGATAVLRQTAASPTLSVSVKLSEDGCSIDLPDPVAPPYHPGFASLIITDRHDFRNQCRRCQVWAGDGTLTATSRGVVIEVPFAATLSQVSRVFPLPAGVVSMSLFDMPGCGGASKTVLAEFVTAAAAASFVQEATSRPRQLEDGHGKLHGVRAYLIPTLTSQARGRESELLEKGVTRRITFVGFPQAGVWRFVNRINVPLYRILLLEYDCRSCELTVEFASIFDAGQAVYPVDEADMDEFSFLSKLRYGSSLRFVKDEPGAAAADGKYPIPYTSPHDLAVRFNQPPWNQADQPYLPYRPQWSQIHAMAREVGVDAEEVFPFLDRLEVEDEVVYSIIGSNIKLTRQGGNYSLPPEDEAKLFMASTLHDPCCRDMWDAHFAALGVPNRRKYEEYGMIARQRREEAETGGKGEYMKGAEVPEVVRKYCSKGRQRKIRYIGHEYMEYDSQ